MAKLAKLTKLDNQKNTTSAWQGTAYNTTQAFKPLLSL